MQSLFGKILVAAALVAAASSPAWADPAKRQPKNAKEDVAQIGSRDIGKAINFYNLEQEVALGRQVAQEVEQTAKIVDDPVIAEYVNRIGQNLVNNSDAKVPFTIKVIDSEEVNAFALPGGYFYVNTGLIELAADEAELAGVMAHEIAHVTARHGTRSLTRSQLVEFATIPLLFIGGWAGYGVQQAANFAIPMTMLKFSRSFEKEADFLGVQYLYKTGYDPAAMVQFFERLKAIHKRNKSAIAQAFSTHPLTQKRIKSVQKTIDELLPAQREYAVSTSEFRSVQERIARLRGHQRTAGTDENQPRLRRNTGTEPIIPGDPNETGAADGEDERPVLKRRPPTES